MVYLQLSMVRAFLSCFFCNVLGIPVFLVAHLSIFSGFVSCNTGSYFRETEPIRFW